MTAGGLRQGQAGHDLFRGGTGFLRIEWLCGWRVLLSVLMATPRPVSGGLTDTAWVIRSDRRRARVIASRTAPADDDSNRQKQVSSSGTKMVCRSRTGAPCSLT